MTTIQYLRQEGLFWYLKFGLWVPAVFGGAGYVAVDRISDEAIKIVGNGIVAASGGILAIVVALVTYQLGTLNVQDIRSFIHSQQAKSYFERMLAGIKWGAFMSLFWLVLAVVLTVVPSRSRFGVGSFVFGASLSHLWAAVRAAFDFFDIKMEIAAKMEEGADKERAPKDRLNPPG